MGDVKIKVACTNKSALSPARAFGEFPTRFAMERSIDMVARACNLEPAEVRRKNLVKSLPYTSITGEYFDSGDFVKVFDNLMARVDLAGFRSEQAEARKQGRYLGIGFAVGVELSGVASELLVPMENQPGYGAATVRLDPRGKVLVFEGDAPGGQGHETTVAQVVAYAFGIHPNDIVVQTGDTGTTPFGSGTIGARAGSYFVSAAYQACIELKRKIAKVMAHDLELGDVDPDDFEFKDGEIVYKRTPNARKTFREMVERIIMAPINLPPGVSGGLEQTSFFEADKPMICFNADCCKVEVDVNTGQWKILSWTTSEDVGRIINPQIVAGQMHGAIVQGISNACFEQFVYADNGQQLTADFENYKLATAADVPNIEVTHAPTPCPHTPLGSRGIGEGRPSAIPGALSNAICDALSPVRDRDHGAAAAARQDLAHDPERADQGRGRVGQIQARCRVAPAGQEDSMTSEQYTVERMLETRVARRKELTAFPGIVRRHGHPALPPQALQHHRQERVRGPGDAAGDHGPAPVQLQPDRGRAGPWRRAAFPHHRRSVHADRRQAGGVLGRAGRERGRARPARHHHRADRRDARLPQCRQQDHPGDRDRRRR